MSDPVTRWRCLHWYHAPFYVLAIPFMVVSWLIKQAVDAGFDLYEALTGKRFD